jgi:hypothetical protein
MFRPGDEGDDELLRSVKALDALLEARTIPELQKAYLKCATEGIHSFGIKLQVMEGLTAVTEVPIETYFMWAFHAFSNTRGEEQDRDAA